MGRDDGLRIWQRRMRGRDDGYAAHDDKYYSGDDEYESEKFVQQRVRKLKKFRQRRVRNSRQWVRDRTTTGRTRERTAEIGRRWVVGGRQRAWRVRRRMSNGQRRVLGGHRRVTGRATMGPTPRRRVASTVYKGRQFSLGFMLQLAASDPSSHGALCRTCAEFLWTSSADSRQICSKTNNKKLLSPMASGSDSGFGKRPGYVDLDAPNPSSEDPWDTRLVSTALI